MGGIREQQHQTSQEAIGTPDTTTERPKPLGRQRTLSVPEPMLTTASAVDERLKEMNDAFLASLQGLGSKRRQASERDDSSTGSSTARAASSGASTIGRRTILDPLSIGGSRQDSGSVSGTSISRRATGGAAGNGYAGLPPAPFIRPRLASTASVRSGMSVASEEVMGRMDPELDDEKRRGGA